MATAKKKRKPAKRTTTKRPAKSSAAKRPAKSSTTKKPAKSSAAKSSAAKRPAKSSAAKRPTKSSATKSTRAKPAPTAKPTTGGLDRSLQSIYDAFVAWCGADEVAAALAQIDLHGATPYLFTRRMAEKLPSLPAKLAPLTAENVVAYYLHPDNEHDIEHYGDVEDWDPAYLSGCRVIYPEDYCEPGRKILEKCSRLVTMRGDAVIATAGMNGGDIWEIGSTTAVNHGSVEKLIAELRARLG